MVGTWNITEDRKAQWERRWRTEFPGITFAWMRNRCVMTNPKTGISVDVYVFAASHQPVSDFDESGHCRGAVDLKRRYDEAKRATA